MTQSNDDPSRISPTAYYTGHVWCRHGLSPASMNTPEGERFFNLVAPFISLARRFTGGLTLEEMLVSRHRVIDHLLAEQVSAGRVRVVIEVAAGLAARGIRFTQRYAPERLHYAEADLPDMLAYKRSLLQRSGVLSPGLSLHEVDARNSGGPHSLEALVDELVEADRAHGSDHGLAVITEGLLSYLPWSHVSTLWRRIAATLRTHGGGMYLTDIHMRSVTSALPVAMLVRRAIGTIVRGRTFMHVRDPDDARAVMLACGFDRVEVHTPAAYTQLLSLPSPRAVHPVHVMQGWVT